MKTIRQRVQGAIMESGLPVILAGTRTATNSLKASLGTWIQNQRTMESYPDREDKSQSMALNAMRIEAGIKFLLTPFSGK